MKRALMAFLLLAAAAFGQVNSASQLRRYISDPPCFLAGQVWYNTTSGVAKYCDNSLTAQTLGSGASIAFSALSSGTNTTAAMVVGTGATLTASGSGTIVATGGNADTATTATNVSGLVGPGNGGSGVANPTAHGVLRANGSSAFDTIAPSTSGNVLTSNGTDWTSAAPVSSVSNCSVQYAIAYYAATGRTASCLTNFVTDANNNLTINQGANNTKAFTCIRATDTGPTGKCFDVENAANNTSQFSVDVSGNVVALGSVTASSFITPAGSAAGALQLTQGTAPSLPSNSFSLFAPASITTSYGWSTPSGENASAGVLHLGAASSHISAATVSKVVDADITFTTPALGTPSAVVLTNATGLPAAQVPAVLLTSGTSRTLANAAEIIVCTSTCTVTPPGTLTAGQQFCVQNDDNVSTVITLAAVSGIQYEATARTSYGTANHTMTSGGAVKDQMCMIAISTTKFNVFSYTGTWTNN